MHQRVLTLLAALVVYLVSAAATQAIPRTFLSTNGDALKYFANQLWNTRRI